MNLYLEDNTDIPLKKVLEVFQERILHYTTYFGVPALKNPIDFWVYQEIICARKPTVIIEIGNRFGGSTLALAHILDLIGLGKVIGIDIDHSNIYPQVREHPRITLLEGDACSLFEEVKKILSNDDNVMIIEDSSHTYENTLNVLNLYSELVKKDDYFIVEDSICHHGLNVGPKPGPYEAIEEFIEQHPDFYIDREKESFLVTWNPKGYLRRK